jgi:superfamily II DNA or RNA helicase
MSASTPLTFDVGAMVRARGREWVVLPSDDADVLRLRPLGGTDDDARGFFLPVEGGDIQPAALTLPDPALAGNAMAAVLLRDAVRLGLRSAAGPLRSVGRLSVQPHPYQLVPLLMALRLEPVRLLIGDDVGVGKTIEAAMIARELLDRGEVQRVCVLCPPHLCEQWQAELDSKFHLPAVVVRPGTVTGLERDLPLDRAVFQAYPYTIVSIDFIKSDRRRAQFIQTCPEFVIVDEAHTAAQTGGSGAQQQRHSLLRELASDPARHLLLVTATPHSGDPGAFASLIGLLAPELEHKVAALELAGASPERAQLARQFVQRRRGDVQQYLQEHTRFPRRVTQGGKGLTLFRQRVRWWAALALLRCVGSSPAAAEAALRTRAAQQERLDLQEADRLGQDSVFDQVMRDEAEGDDATPAADTEEGEGETPERRALLALARRAQALRGAGDAKLTALEAVLRDLLDAGFSPIVFCRYIATAEYVGDWLTERLSGTRLAVVTGKLPAEERLGRVASLGDQTRRVLVATDCLSEGVNLQEHFDAVVHYDLAWNPTRHEQREGRVDRFGQERPEVRTVLLYGQDNMVDGVVLKVLLRKTEQIRRTLGVSIPLPLDTNTLLETIMEGMILHEASPQQLSLFVDEEQRKVDRLWQTAADREQLTRTVFAQHGLKPAEVAAELTATLEAAGTPEDVERFVLEACSRLNVPTSKDAGSERWRLGLDALPAAVRFRAGLGDEAGPALVSFQTGMRDARYLDRTHPLVEALAGYTLDTAMEPPAGGQAPPATRAAVLRTRAVTTRTVLLLLRLRFLIEKINQQGTYPMLAEECLLRGFAGDPQAPGWLPPEEVQRLARAEPSANMPTGQAAQWLAGVLAAEAAWRPALAGIARERAEELLAAHRRVRDAARLRGVRYTVTPQGAVDVLGLYVLLPAPAAR